MIIKTQRLEIRPWRADDWRDLSKIAADFESSQYSVYDMPFPSDEGEIQELTRRFADSGLFFAVVLLNTQEMIGYVCFHNSDGIFDLGFCFRSKYHGKGYACESCTAVMQYAKQTFSIKKFTAGTALANAPSCKLLQKLGFTQVATERLSFRKDENGDDILFEGGLFEIVL